MGSSGSVAFGEVKRALEYEEPLESYLPQELFEKDYDSKMHSEDIVILDEELANDLKHCCRRRRGGRTEGPADIIESIEAVHLKEGKVFLDHQLLDSIDEPGYKDCDLVSEESRRKIEELLREYTRPLNIQEWSDLLNEDGDQLYREIAYYQGAVLLTHDNDFSEDVAVTPGKFLEGYPV